MSKKYNSVGGNAKEGLGKQLVQKSHRGEASHSK